MGRRAVGKMKTLLLRERKAFSYEVKRFLTACICLLFEIVSQQNSNFQGENGSKNGNFGPNFLPLMLSVNATVNSFI